MYGAASAAGGEAIVHTAGRYECELGRTEARLLLLAEALAHKSTNPVLLRLVKIYGAGTLDVRVWGDDNSPL